MNEANRIKLRDFIRSLPPSYVGRATSIVCGSLVMTCTDRDLDEAIEVAMDQIHRYMEDANITTEKEVAP